MGIFGKIFSRKKRDEPDFDSLTQKDLQEDSFPEDNLGLQEKSPFEEQPTDNLTPFPHPNNAETPQRAVQPLGTGNRDLELINSKLDTIKAILTSMDQRIANLERAAGIGQKQQRLW